MDPMTLLVWLMLAAVAVVGAKRWPTPVADALVNTPGLGD